MAHNHMAHIHLIGIGGTGLSAIARVLLESGATVSGSDKVLSPLAESLQASGCHIAIGHAAANIAGADLVVRSSAVPDDNPEVVAARAAGIPVLKRSEFLGTLLAGRTGLAVAGTHGKTTTTAMLAWTLVALGRDPSYIIGGVARNLASNAHSGKGPDFVIEADEYDRMFLGLQPQISIVTTLEYDHPDCFPTPEDYMQAFLDFALRLEPGGSLLACGDDPGAQSLLQRLEALGRPGLSYGFDPRSSYRAVEVTPNTLGGFSFRAVFQPTGLPPIPLAAAALQVPGRHNVLNALAVLAAVHCMGSAYMPQTCQAAAAALQAFSGVGRRFDVIGQAAGITIIDDYGHHPTEIRTTLAAARTRYPGQRLWAVWQPHTYSRTAAFSTEFASAFNDADRVIVTEIYAARESAQDFSAALVVASMTHPAVQFIPSLPDVTHTLVQQLQAGDVLLVFSAGDADQVSAQTLKALQTLRVK